MEHYEKQWNQLKSMKINENQWKSMIFCKSNGDFMGHCETLSKTMKIKYFDDFVKSVDSMGHHGTIWKTTKSIIFAKT